MRSASKAIIATIIAGSFFALPQVSNAATLTFLANLSGANEAPPNGSPGTGTATAILDTTAQTLQILASFSGLTSNDTAAHVHCCIAPIPGPNLMVATTVPAFPGFPLGVTAGSYSSPLFDLTKSAIYNPAFVTAEGGLGNAEAAFIAALVGGQAYFNIHTTNFPGGEIRGQLNPVPLPTALPLFATALGVMGLLGWRRKRKASAH